MENVDITNKASIEAKIERLSALVKRAKGGNLKLIKAQISSYSYFLKDLE